MTIEIELEPVVTEKTSKQVNDNQFVFKVDQSITKIMMQQYLSTKYKVVIESVNSMNQKPKKRRRGRIIGFTKAKKKMVVKVKESKEAENIKKLFG